MSSEPNSNLTLHGPATRTSYLFGVVVRRAFDLISAPYRALTGLKWSDQLGRRSSLDRASPSRRISRNLMRMMERIQSIEHRLIVAAGDDSLDGLSGDLESVNGAAEALAGSRVGSRSAADRGELRYALGNLDSLPADERTALILEALQYPDADTRRLAARAAVQEYSSATVFSLILSLDDADPRVRAEVKDAIESIAGVTINLDPTTDSATREAELERLKTWWKEERFTRLTAELETVLKP